MSRSSWLSTLRGIRKGRWLLGPAALIMLLVPASASAAENFTWGGAGILEVKEGIPIGSFNWSLASNWKGNAVPSGAVGTLSFPELTGACAPPPPPNPGALGCYLPHNDLTGIGADALNIQDGGYETLGGSSVSYIYHLSGNRIALGGGGLTATPDARGNAWTAAVLEMPITLSAPQTWSISGNSFDGILFLYGDVSGPSDAVEFELSNGSLDLGSDIEAGPVSVTGSGSVYLGEPRGPHYAGTINGETGNPVTIGEGISVFDENTNAFTENGSSMGALTLSDHSSLQLGQPEFAGGVTLKVNGGIGLSPSSKLSLLYNSHVHATGKVDLGGTHLFVEDGFSLVDGTPTCNVLDQDTLVSTSGELVGTFAGLPDGAIMPLDCEGMPTQPKARITYTPHAAIATLVESTDTTLEVSGPEPTVGQPVTYTASVNPERHGEGVPAGTVQFLDGGAPIGSCSAQPVTPGESVSVATCTVAYPATGIHDISASYQGNGTYVGSTSASHAVNVKAPAARRKAKRANRCKKKHGKAKTRCLRKAHKHHRAH